MIINVRVTTKAKFKRVEETALGCLKVYVSSAPEDNKANKAVLKALAEYYGVRESRISIIQGERSRDKRIEIK
ncbi:MAG: DUF167 domain-containing protein [Candidatus Omnitrophota bacterium]